ncbi:MAG: exo-beta-1,3-glucanase, partial [Methylobacter sp.]
DYMFVYLIGVGVIALIFGETKAFMDGHDFILEHPDFYEGLPFALSYTLYNQQLLAWLLCLCILSVPFWTRAADKVQA